MKNAITATWEDLLESLATLEDEVRASAHKNADASCASIQTLSLALSGLGRAWQEVTRRIPDPAPELQLPNDADSRFTPQRAYTRPLAQALLELGAPRLSPAIQRVGELMASQLTAADYEPLSKTRQIRWDTTTSASHATCSASAAYWFRPTAATAGSSPPPAKDGPVPLSRCRSWVIETRPT